MGQETKKVYNIITWCTPNEASHLHEDSMGPPNKNTQIYNLGKKCRKREKRLNDKRE